MPFMSNQECFKEVDKLVRSWTIGEYRYHIMLFKVRFSLTLSFTCRCVFYILQRLNAFLSSSYVELDPHSLFASVSDSFPARRHRLCMSRARASPRVPLRVPVF